MPTFHFNPPKNHALTAKDVKKAGNGYHIEGFGFTVMDRSVGEAGFKDPEGNPLFAKVPSQTENPYPNAVEKKIDDQGFRGGFIATADKGSVRRRRISWEFNGSLTFPNGIPVGYTQIGRLMDDGEIRYTDAERDFGSGKWEQLKCIANDIPFMTHREKLVDERRKRAARSAKQQRDLELISQGTSDAGEIAKLTAAVLEQNKLLMAQVAERNAAAPVAAGAAGK